MTVARPPGIGRSGIAVALGSGLANVLGYVFLVMLSRLYAPQEFGQVTALLTLGTVASVPALALQLAVAREVARDRAQGEERGPRERTGWLVGAASAALVLISAPILGRTLDVPMLGLVAVAAMVIPFAAASSYLGLTLGSHRPLAYAVSLTVMAIAKLVTGVASASVSATPTQTVWILAGATVMAAACLRVISGLRGDDDSLAPSRLGLGVVARASAAVASFLILSSLDVLLARAALSAGDSGLYAAGNLFTRIGIWGPQFVAITIFPYVAAGAARSVLARAIAAVAAIGVVGCGLTALVGTEILTRMSGIEYASVGPLTWLFLLLGVLLSLVNLALMADIARHGSTVAAAIWAAIPIEILVVGLWANGSVRVVLITATSITATLAGVSCWRVLVAAPQDASAARDVAGSAGWLVNGPTSP